MDHNLEEKFQKATGLEFAAFYRKYKPKLVWYLTKYTRDQDIAEDFADDAFTQSLLKIDSYNREKSQIHTWIYKIAENLVKKDFKDKKRLPIVSLDKENEDNQNLISVIPNGQFEESNIMEQDGILLRKAELVKSAIFTLPEKYKKVMILRELEKRPYLDIAEMCTKDLHIVLNNDTCILPTPTEFSSLKILNSANMTGYVVMTYGQDNISIELEIKPKSTFFIDKEEVDNVSNIEIFSFGEMKVHYVTTTNLSTIKSQISKGRQLIQAMVGKQFKLLDEHGLF